MQTRWVRPGHSGYGRSGSIPFPWGWGRWRWMRASGRVHGIGVGRVMLGTGRERSLE